MCLLYLSILIVTSFNVRAAAGDRASDDIWEVVSGILEQLEEKENILQEQQKRIEILEEVVGEQRQLIADLQAHVQEKIPAPTTGLPDHKGNCGKVVSHNETIELRQTIGSF